MLIAPSMLSSDFAKLGEETARMDRSGADWIHLDVMDAHFVPNLTFGAPVIGAIRRYTKLPFDVHLMIADPLRYVGDFLKAGADIISFHLEADSSIPDTIRAIRDGGAKPALAIKPKTPVEAVYPYLDQVDMVLVMTVEPGFGGQSFMEPMMEKVRALKSRGAYVEVDGGINLETAPVAKAAGVDVCVAGTSVFGAPDAAAAIRALREGNGVIL